MAKAKPNFYVVWSGKQPGIYPTWDECRRQVIGVKGARFQGFVTQEEAQEAYSRPAPELRRGSKKIATGAGGVTPKANSAGEIITDAFAVDAACSGNPGMMEYQGVDVESRARIFHLGPIYGTNNIGEFLAIVHALALQKQQGTRRPIYSDSRNALLWVRAKKCKTKLPRNNRTAQVYNLIERAERWLQSNSFSDIPLLKWHTDRWGEIPADFGRK